jgi:hypothetical protein
MSATSSYSKPATRRRGRHLEDAEQRALMEWLELQHPTVFAFTHHSPNGGARSKAEAGIFRALGVKPGFPDVACYMPRGPFVGLAVEMKQKGATPSSIRAEQHIWLARLRLAGWRAEAAPGFEHARRIFEEYLRGEVRPPIESWGYAKAPDGIFRAVTDPRKA